MYSKIFTKILDSSIWLESNPTRIVWLTFLAAMDETGFAQFASPANVAHRARVSAEEAEAAINCLCSPDANSSDPDNEGRRLERVPGGWIVLNAIKYRDIVTRAVAQEKTRNRVAAWRERQKAGNAPVTHEKRHETPSEALADAEADTKSGEREADKPPTRPTVPKPEIPTSEQWQAHRAAVHPSWPVNDALAAWSFYEGNGWRTGKNPVKKWQACANTCFLRWKRENPTAGQPARIGKTY